VEGLQLVFVWPGVDYVRVFKPTVPASRWTMEKPATIRIEIDKGEVMEHYFN